MERAETFLTRCSKDRSTGETYFLEFKAVLRKLDERTPTTQYKQARIELLTARTHERCEVDRHSGEENGRCRSRVG